MGNGKIKNTDKNINKEEKLIKWAKQNPYLTDALKLNWLDARSGSCSVVTISGDGFIEKYLDGTCIKYYDFMFCVMLSLSDTTDRVNVENMFSLRQWQSWIDNMEKEGNYPDFGNTCGNYELQNLSDSPQLAQVYDNGTAKYQFPARLIYTEE